MAAEAAQDGQTEVSVLIPMRTYRRSWAFLLHGKNADHLVTALGSVPHVNATLIPFNVADLAKHGAALVSADDGQRATKRAHRPQPAHPASPSPEVQGTTPIANLSYRQMAKIAGRVRSVRIQPWSGVSALECTVTDASEAEVLVVFLGRQEIPGIRTGTDLVVEGMVGERRGRLAIMNPDYALLRVPEAGPED
jgi:hypothetical protein